MCKDTKVGRCGVRSTQKNKVLCTFYREYMAGIKKITIPIKQDELTIEKVVPYLPTILDKFTKNAQKIHSDYETYCLQHDILSKKRVHDDTDINNIVLEPHIKAMVDWKTGYVFGNPIKYAQTKDSETDDITYLNKYARYANRSAIDQEVATWAYATGVGYYFIEPTSEKVDVETQAPFELFCREADTCTKVYSSYNGKKPLFDLLYTTINAINERGSKETFAILDIYLPDYYYQYRCPISAINMPVGVAPSELELVNAEVRAIYKKLPLVEKRLNPDGIGIVEMSKCMQNALDTIASNGVDNIQEVVNTIYKYMGINMGDTTEERVENHKSVRKNGAIVIPYLGNDKFQPDLKIENTSALDFSDVLSFAENIKRTMYETVGVPLATNSTNSGGTTKSGSEVANGYDNAYNRALTDINNFLPADTDLLDKMLFICQSTANNKVNDLQVSEIEIKYSLNLNDNMQIKTQSLGTCIGIKMPPAMALRICRLSNDPEAEGKQWEDYIAKKEQEEKDREMQAYQTQNIDTSNRDDEE